MAWIRRFLGYAILTTFIGLLAVVFYLRFFTIDGWMLSSVYPLWPTGEVKSNISDGIFQIDSAADARVVHAVDSGNFPLDQQSLGVTEAEFAMLHAKVLERIHNQRNQSATERIERLTARACLLQPSNLMTWRFRALSLASVNHFGYGDRASLTPEEYLDVLSECQRHDPGNGLYDDLRAGQLVAKLMYLTPPRVESENEEPVDRQVSEMILAEIHRFRVQARECQFCRLPYLRPEALHRLLEGYRYSPTQRVLMLRDDLTSLGFEVLGEHPRRLVRRFSDDYRVKLEVNTDGSLFCRGVLASTPPSQIPMWVTTYFSNCIENNRFNIIVLGPEGLGDFDFELEKSLIVQQRQFNATFAKAYTSIQGTRPRRFGLYDVRTNLYHLPFQVSVALCVTGVLLGLGWMFGDNRAVGKRILFFASAMGLMIPFSILGAAPSGLLPQGIYKRFCESLLMGLPFALVLAVTAKPFLKGKTGFTVRNLLLTALLLAVAFATVVPLSDFLLWAEEFGYQSGQYWLTPMPWEEGMSFALLPSYRELEVAFGSWLNYYGLTLSTLLTLGLVLLSTMSSPWKAKYSMKVWWDWFSSGCLATGRVFLPLVLLMGIYCMTVMLCSLAFFRQSEEFELRSVYRSSVYREEFDEVYETEKQLWNIPKVKNDAEGV